jgi:hypothetical protein
MADNVAATPADVRAEDGNVQVKGPDGIRYAFTPDAAVETSERLLQGGMEAQGQRYQEELSRRKPTAP